MNEGAGNPAPSFLYPAFAKASARQADSESRAPSPEPRAPSPEKNHFFGMMPPSGL